jgi:AcrR family transcriptional regulator
MSVKEAGAGRLSARERLLAAADDLFYNEGVHTVGIDRVIEQAGVAKASLYNTFGSKDELVRAYLEARHASVTQLITRAVERYDTPRERLLAVFEAQGEMFATPGYRGCAFARASAESQPGDLTEQATDTYRRWVRALLTELTAQAGAPEPEVLARQLHLLYDGSGQAARLDHDPAAAPAARAAAATLLGAALASGTETQVGARRLYALRDDLSLPVAHVLVRAESRPAGLQAQQAKQPPVGTDDRGSPLTGSDHRPVHFGQAGPARHSAPFEPPQRRGGRVKSPAPGEVATLHDRLQVPALADDQRGMDMIVAEEVAYLSDGGRRRMPHRNREHRLSNGAHDPIHRSSIRTAIRAIEGEGSDLGSGGTSEGHSFC